MALHVLKSGSTKEIIENGVPLHWPSKDLRKPVMAIISLDKGETWSHKFPIHAIGQYSIRVAKDRIIRVHVCRSFYFCIV